MTLAARGLTHGYGAEPVFEDVSLSVEPGAVTAVVGPSGVGKSTLLRLLACFDTPDTGVVEYDGTDLWALSEADRLAVRRRMGLVAQEASLFDASVRRNASYGLRVRRCWRHRIGHELRRAVGRTNGAEAVVTDALELVGLATRADSDATDLSGGEAQRLAFARALAYDPEILLLDEPTSDLDPHNTAVIEEAVCEARARGIGVALATHDLHQVRRLADRVAVLCGGEVVESGDATAVLESPTDDRTRRFLEGELVTG